MLPKIAVAIILILGIVAILFLIFGIYSNSQKGY